VNQVQLKICSAPFSFVLLAVQHGVFCSHERNDCLFSDQGFFDGWTYKNGVLLVAQVLNNFVLGLVYKKVNAVVKYLAYAQSLWITYLINIAMLGVPFNIDLFLVVWILVAVVIAYSFAKVSPAPCPTSTQADSRSLELREPLGARCSYVGQEQDQKLIIEKTQTWPIHLYAPPVGDPDRTTSRDQTPGHDAIETMTIEMTQVPTPGSGRRLSTSDAEPTVLV